MKKIRKIVASVDIVTPLFKLRAAYARQEELEKAINEQLEYLKELRSAIYHVNEDYQKTKSAVKDMVETVNGFIKLREKFTGKEVENES